jgi:Rod binding domain-containing protein
MTHAAIHSGASTAKAMPSAAEIKRHQALVKQTQKWVAQSFYGTMLKQMRKSPFHSEIFDGGRGGQMFHALMDQQLASHMTQHTAPGLVNSIVRKIEGGRAMASYKAQSNWLDIANQARSHVSTVG